MSRKPRRWIPLWAVAVLIGMAIGTVWLRLWIVRTSYQINQADLMAQNLKQSREEMELKVTALRSPRRLEILAKTKYGLLQPKTDQVVHLNGKTH